MKNSTYWTYNLPLQIWPDEDGGARVLNYMPRRERCCGLRLEEILGDQTREEFLETAALMFENMARLMREAIKDPTMNIYYHDEGFSPKS